MVDLDKYGYVVTPDSIGHCQASIEVLPELKGRPVDDVTIAYVLSLNPTSIRVRGNMEESDGRTGRVTITVGDSDAIVRIRMEVCPPLSQALYDRGIVNGHELGTARRKT